jgi:methylenetetrahydrofolate reductase (NADPH)
MAVSFEFFPPKTQEGAAKLLLVQQKLLELKPAFFSVTYGAGGSTRERTLAAVQAAIQETGIDTAPHISGMGSSLEEIEALLLHYQAIGIKRLVVLRGDRPSGLGVVANEAFLHASDLVEFIRQKTADQFQLYVAAYPECHPESACFEQDMAYVNQKFELGANWAITQYFYNAQAFEFYINHPLIKPFADKIIPGIMPITQLDSLKRFSMLCGADVPRWLIRRLEYFQDDPQSLKDFGLDVLSSLIEDLKRLGVQNFHLYTLNQADAAVALASHWVK